MGRPKKETNTDGAEMLTVQPLEGKEANIKRTVPLAASEDTMLKKGRLVVPTEAVVEEGNDALVVSTADNAINGLLVEGGIRLEETHVISVHYEANAKVNVALYVCDETTILRNTPYGTKMDNLCIPKGTHIADMILF